MAVCDVLDLCFEAEVDPNDPNFILVRETANPEVVVRTPRKNFIAFVQAIHDGKYADLLRTIEPDPVVIEASKLEVGQRVELHASGIL